MAEFWHSDLLPHLESRRSCREIACYRPHTHDTFSIGLIDSGTTVFSSSKGEDIRLVSGDVILIPAGHLHSCNPDHGTWRYQMIQADQDWLSALLPRQAANPFSAIRVFRHPEIYRHFNSVNDLLFADADTQRIKDGLRLGFEDCATYEAEHQMTAGTDAVLLARLGPVLLRLRHNEMNPSLDELAAIAGMGKYQLIRSMKRVTGFAPLAWRQNYRITEARRMLRDGQSLTDTAHALGFVDQSHFHRVFRAHVASSPGTYRG